MSDNTFLKRDKEYLNELYQKYAILINDIKFHDVKADNSIILNILDYSFNFTYNIVNIDVNLKQLCMLIILKECQQPIDYITNKYTSSNIVEKEITDFLSYYDDNYANYISNIDFYSDEFYRDYPFILGYIDKKNAGELPPAT